MTPEPPPRPGFRFWIVLTVVLLMVGNVALHGWTCWNRRPGGSFSAILYLAVFLLSLPSLPGMFRFLARISDIRLRRSLLYLCVLFSLGHVLLNVIVGPWIFTSAHGGMLFYHATFLSCVIVAISPDLVKMSFSFR